MQQVSSTLCLHAGARRVSLEELARVQAPPPEGRWFPLSHGSVLARVKETLGEAGYVVRREQLGLSRSDARFFGVLDLSTALTSGVSLAVGIRNSTDKSFPLGFCAGSRVFCCDNLAFRAELLVRKKHTRYGEQPGCLRSNVERLCGNWVISCAEKPKVASVNSYRVIYVSWCSGRW
jgi:hypothetical protein